VTPADTRRRSWRGTLVCATDENLEVGRDRIDGPAIRDWLRRASAVQELEKAHFTDLDAPIGGSDAKPDHI
jgi:hypothetical protein